MTFIDLTQNEITYKEKAVLMNKNLDKKNRRRKNRRRKIEHTRQSTIKELCKFFDSIEGLYGFKIKDMKDSIKLNISTHPHDLVEGHYTFHSSWCDGTRRSDEFCYIEHPSIISILPFNCHTKI